MKHFWGGFEKRAINLYGTSQGLKALNRGNRPMQHLTARPISQKAVVGKTIAPAIPSAVAAQATHMPKPKMPAGSKLTPAKKVEQISAKGVTPAAI